MSDRDTLIADLQATREALTRQLEYIDVLAAEAGVPREVYMAPDGHVMAAPVLSALASAQIALLDAESEIMERAVDPLDMPLACQIMHDGHTCALAVDHEGEHTTVDGVTFDA